MLTLVEVHAQVAANAAVENLVYFESARQAAASCSQAYPGAKQQWESWANLHFPVYTASVEAILATGEKQQLDKTGQLYLLSEVSSNIQREVAASQKRKPPPCAALDAWLDQLALNFKH